MRILSVNLYNKQLNNILSELSCFYKTLHGNSFINFLNKVIEDNYIKKCGKSDIF